MDYQTDIKKSKSKKIVPLSLIKDLNMKDKAISLPNKDSRILNDNNRDKPTSCNEWTVFGKLLVLFTANLITWNRMIDACKVIENYGLTYEKDPLVVSNMQFSVKFSIFTR